MKRLNQDSKTGIKTVRALVGDISTEDLKYVEHYASSTVGIFMPQGGSCGMALRHEHSHPSYMFVHTYDARTSVAIGGKLVNTSAGQLYALAPNIKHTELPVEDGMPRYIALMVSTQLLEATLKHYAPRALPSGIRQTGLCLQSPADLLLLVRRFIAEASSGLPGSSAVLSALGHELSHLLVRLMLGIHSHEPPSEALRANTRMEVDRAIELMNSRLHERISMAELAREARMSCSNFGRVFKDELGQTPMRYLETIRLERARRLLAAGSHTLMQAALECGFPNSAHFTERFRRKFGITPGRYRATLEPCRKSDKLQR